MNEMSVKEKQPRLLELFVRSIRNQRLGHAYLFEGARGTGKKELANWIARTIFCEKPQDGNPCFSCRSCLRIDEGNLPDLIELAPDGQSIKVDQIRQLKTEFFKSSVESSKKVYIIEDAEKMTISAANSLLTFLEEPGKDTYLFLLTTVKENILPTIRSRCQIIHFQPLKREVMEELLLSAGIDSQDAELLSAVTNDLEEAKGLAEDELFHALKEKSWNWFKLLTSSDPMALIYVPTSLLEILKDKSHSLFYLDLLLFHYRDLLYVSFGNEEAVVQKKQLPEYKKMAQFLKDSKKITQAIESILQGKQALNANVQTQGVLESIVLKNQ